MQANQCQGVLSLPCLQGDVMALAIFDLDNTLIGRDSDHLWGEFLIAQGIVDGDEFKATNDQFYQDYVNGRLDIHAYQRFVLGVLAAHPVGQLYQWRFTFLREWIEPIILPKAGSLLARTRAAGDLLLILTCTNRLSTATVTP